MTVPIRYIYDVFVSYSSDDRNWVHDVLLPRLKKAGLKICIADRDFELGVPHIVNIEQAVEQSRKILPIMTLGWLKNKWSQLDLLLAQTDDPAGYLPKVLPLLLKPCNLPKRLAMLSRADFTGSALLAEEWTRLLRALSTKARIFISYKRHVQPDAELATRVFADLQRAGHDVFIDQVIKVGQEWAKEIEQQIKASDCVIVLLSAESVQSEMLIKEVEHAYRHNQHTGKARILPVRVDYTEALPYPLNTYLDHLQYTEWRPRTKGSTQLVVLRLLDAIGYGDSLPSSQPAIAPADADNARSPAPSPAADPRFIASLAAPGGAMRPRDTLYIEREADRILRRELSEARGTTTTIRAPRQTGKSSLLIRGIDQAEQQGHKVVFMDLQLIDNNYLQEPDIFLRFFTTLIVNGLRLDIKAIERVWERAVGASNKITDLMGDYILPRIHSKLILAIDEADRLLRTPINSVFLDCCDPGIIAGQEMSYGKS